MTLAEYLKLLKIDQIEDDEEFCNTEYDAIRFYFNNYKNITILLDSNLQSSFFMYNTLNYNIFVL